MTTAESTRFHTPNDFRLFLRAMHLALRAQSLRRHSLSWVLRRLLAAPAAGPDTGVDAIIRAMVRATGRVGRIPGMLDSCLLRCLVAATLLRAHGQVRVHIGFRPGLGGHDGHAWLTLDGAIAYDGGGAVDGAPYVEVSSIVVAP